MHAAADIEQMEGNTRENITFTTTAKKVGYETVIPLKTNGAFVVANALAADGTVMATSDVWDMALGATVSRLLSLDFFVPNTDHYLFAASWWSGRLLYDWLRSIRRLRFHDPGYDVCVRNTPVCHGDGHQEFSEELNARVQQPLMMTEIPVELDFPWTACIATCLLSCTFSAFTYIGILHD